MMKLFSTIHPLDDSAEYKAYIPVKESDLKGIAVEEFEQVYFS